MNCVPYVMSGSLLIISLQREENKEDSLSQFTTWGEITKERDLPYL